MAETQPGSAASEPDKAEMESQVTVLLQPNRMTLHNFSIYFMKKRKKSYTATGLVCIKHCDTQLSSTPDMELGIPGSCELGSFWARQQKFLFPSTAEREALHSF